MERPTTLKNGNFQFGDFELDGDERVLRKNGTPLSLPPKVLKLLFVLVENRGRIVEKDDLMLRLWPDTFVEEGNLTYSIKMLRRALGEKPSSPKYIQTVPRRGYRFVAEARPDSERILNGTSRLHEGIIRADLAGLNDSSLIGRETELADVTKLLSQDDVRLLTLTGPGGTGKTRLSREVALQIENHFPDGVFFVELAAVNDPMLVAPAIAREVGIKEAGTRQILDLLSDYFGARSAVLILDNVEQVVSAGVQFAQLLRSAPNLKLLVTSRERLKLSIETEYRVQPLALPSPETKETISDLMRFGAVELFVQRALKARHDLVLTDKDTRALSAICHKLDGLPLALELAASRASVLSVEEILAKLENRLTLLTGGPKDMPHRQQTMRSAIQWSYELLSDLDKNVFVRLSVFEGGFTYKGGEKVLADADHQSTPGSDADVLNAVTSLTEKGLLLSEKSIDGELRFRMLVVVRDYALELLARRGDAESLRCSHAQCVLNLVDEAAPNLRSTGSPEWLRRLELDHDNIRAAIRWSMDRDPETAARIVSGVRPLWTVHGHIREGRYWLEEVLKRGVDAPPALQCSLLTGLGNMAQFQGDFETARKVYGQCLEVSRAAGDQRYIAQALRGVGAVDYMDSQFKSASVRIKEALKISRSMNDDFGTAAAVARLGEIACASGDFSEARSQTSEALGIFKRLGYKQGVAAKIANLGVIEFFDGDYESASLYLAEGLDICLEINDEIDIRVMFEVAAALLVEAGDYETAARLSGAAAGRCEAIDYIHETMEHGFRETYLKKLRSVMPASELAAGLADGSEMTVSEGAELALEIAGGFKKNRRRLHLVGRIPQS
ncbi:MAG: tetratricopeptide repeat protein [Acidobacteriota bacterium]